tara:strand:- start:19964 stop:20839 length:876 start_codon:yes stop_codon:yes gene_type:complete
MGLLDGQTQAQYQAGTLGGYQFISLENIIDQFIIAYVGEDKILPKVKRVDVAFHAQRALQELSFDTFKSTKAQEIEIPPTLQMMLPQDYVNYVKLTWKDGAGIEHIIYPASKTSNPKSITQGADGSYTLNSNELQYNAESDTWAAYKTMSPSENTKDDHNYDDDSFDLNIGQRYGLDPQHSQVNGSYYIDDAGGKIHFSSNINGKTVTLRYISDSLGTDSEMQVHKFAEEAMYKCIAYAIIRTRANVQEYIVRRFQKDKFASVRTAKLRLSNLKIEELTQILRGKSKQIKH